MFEKVLVKSPKRARFDFSHGNSLSMRFGMLTPSEVRFIVPGDEVAVSMEQIVRLAPLPVPTFVNMKVRHDWFFVPLSMMYDKRNMDLLYGETSQRNRARCADLKAYSQLFTSYSNPLVAGSIHDYLGYPVITDENAPLAVSDLTTFITTPNAANYSALLASASVDAGLQNTPEICLEPLLAYHYIWRDYYRFTGIQVDTVVEPWLENHIFGDSFQYTTPGNATIGGKINATDRHYSSTSDGWSDYFGKPYFAHYKKDMFTSIRYGSKPTVLIPTGSSGTIPNLREASAIQRFIDIISITGQRYWDKVKGLFNETPEGMTSERVQFLGRYMSFVKVGEVITTASTSQAETGDYAGRGLLIDGKYIFRRRFTEHGWLMCISSIVPDLHYSGLSRQLTDVNMLDTPVPSLAQVGDQSVFTREMSFRFDGVSNQIVLGDQFRYYAYKSAPSEVHGDFLMSSFSPWTALGTINVGGSIIDITKVNPAVWNRIFADTSNSWVFGGRFFVDLTFHEYITRALPKYVAYSL